MLILRLNSKFESYGDFIKTSKVYRTSEKFMKIYLTHCDVKILRLLMDAGK